MQQTRVRKNHAVVWNYFTIYDRENKVAICNTCDGHFSYKSTIFNLKSHLKKRHPHRYEEMLSYNFMLKKCLEKMEQMDDDSDESDHTSSEIWNYFEQETGGRVRCVICRVSRPNNVEELKRHMEENHPKLLQSVGMNQENTGSDQGSVKDDDGTYTEVIYLEEDTKKSPKKPKYLYKTEESTKNVRRSSVIPQRFNSLPEKKRRGSSSSDESPLRKNKKSSELDTFMTYIKCLLKQLPQDTCAKLQMDIVNLIMNVKLNKSNDSSLDVANISLKVPAISNYVTVTENVPNKLHAEADSNRAETSNSYMFSETNDKEQNNMIVEN